MSVVQELGFVKIRHTTVHLSAPQMKLDRGSCSLVMQRCTYIGYMGDIFWGGGGGDCCRHCGFLNILSRWKLLFGLDFEFCIVLVCQDVQIRVYVFCRYTGLSFVSPSGISELDCATTKTDTAERSISIGRESPSFFLVLGALTYFQVPPLGGSRDEKWRSQ